MSRPRPCSSWIGALVAWALFGAPRSATADPSEPIDFARGLRVEVVDGTPRVLRAGASAPLIRGRIFGFTADERKTQLELDLDDCWTFGERETARFTLDMLEARLENAAALKLHRAGKHAEAAAGFRRALRLDPRYVLAGYNLASALNRLGRRAEAAAALAPFFERSLVKVYLAALQDPELTPLLDEPGLATVRVQPPGTAVLRRWDPDWIAYSARHGRIAVLDDHDGLRVFSLKTGELDAVLSLGDRVLQWSGGGSDVDAQLQQAERKLANKAEQVLRKQLPLVNRVLADLGFVEIKQREAGKIEGSPESYTVRFPASAVEVSLSSRELRMVREQRVLGEAEASGITFSLRRISFLPGLDTVVWRWARAAGATDCHRQRGTEILAPVKRAAAR